MSADIFDGQYIRQEWEVLLASGGQRPRMQVSIPPCTGQPFTTRMIMSKLRNSDLRLPRDQDLQGKPEGSLTLKQFLCPSISRATRAFSVSQNSDSFPQHRGELGRKVPKVSQGKYSTILGLELRCRAGGHKLCEAMLSLFSLRALGYTFQQMLTLR